MESAFLTLLVKILGVHLLAVSTPGPDFLLILKNTLKYDKKTSYYSALGVSSGLLVHLTYAIFGLSFMANYPMVEKLVHILGALYLAYLALMTVKGLFNNDKAILNFNFAKEDKNISPMKAFKMGFFTNVFNIKATMFFVSIFTGFFTREHTVGIQVFVGLILLIVTFFIFCLYANLFSFRGFKRIYNKAQKFVDLSLAVAFGAMSVGIITSLF